MTAARVFDITLAQARRNFQRQQQAVQPATILDDLADGIEAVHQLANLAGFSERPRSLIFAIATAAHKAGEDFVELYDAEVADLQGCSERTVRRQRADYLKEARERRFGFIEIIEGDYSRDAGKNAPTRYRFHIGGQIAEAVELARRAAGWPEMSRQKQREAIARACEEVFHTIPDARRQGRKRPRPRLASAEIETCQKVVETKLRKLRERADVLPADEHERLMEDPGELRRWWLRMRSEMDEFFGTPLPANGDAAGFDRGAGQFVRTPPSLSAAPAAEEGEPSAAAVAAWEQIERRAAGELHVRSREVQLRPAPSAEELEAEAVRAEGCREL